MIANLWKIDTVIEEKHKQNPVSLILSEKQSRFEVLIKIDNKDVAYVTDAMKSLPDRIGTGVSTLFKFIKSDSDTEFYALYEQLKGITDVYFVLAVRLIRKGHQWKSGKAHPPFHPKNISVRARSNAFKDE